MPKKIGWRWNNLGLWAVWELSPELAAVADACLTSDFTSELGASSAISAEEDEVATMSAANIQRVLIRMSSVELVGTNQQPLARIQARWPEIAGLLW
jgi:hypothetical protein